MKQNILFAVFSILLTGSLACCGSKDATGSNDGSDNSPRGRATEYLEALKSKDFNKAAKMVMDIDREADADDSRANMIASEFKNDDEESQVKDYSLGDVVKENKMAVWFAATLTLEDGRDVEARVKIDKNMYGEGCECSLRRGERMNVNDEYDNILTEAHEWATPDITTAEGLVERCLECLQEEDEYGLIELYTDDQKKYALVDLHIGARNSIDKALGVDYRERRDLGPIQSYSMGEIRDDDEEGVSYCVCELRHQGGAVNRIKIRMKEDAGQWRMFDIK